MHKNHKRLTRAFTIIELLVVIVIIGILAAIALVSYQGVTQRAVVSSLKSDLKNSLTQLQLDSVDSGLYPATAALANGGKGLESSSDTTYQYKASTSSPAAFCLTATKSGKSMSVAGDGVATDGVCPIGWWRLNGNANDISGNDHSGVIYGATLANGYDGSANGAYYFDSSAGNYIGIPNFNHNVMLQSAFNSNWSLSIWAKFGGSYVSEGVIIGRQGCNGGIYTHGNKFAFAIKGSGCWTGAQTIYGQVIDANWHHFAATYSAGFMSFYQDGVLQGTATLLDMSNYDPNRFGLASGGTSAYLFNGTLDDARVYDVSLTANDVTAIFQAGAL